VLNSIPKKIAGVDKLEILIIDDGSTDKTVEIAKKHGVHHIVRHTRNMGLARSFRDGVDKALELGADIVVNTDGDNQYPQEKISELVQPIIKGKAEIVIADRQTQKIAHFSPFKKLLQRFGSYIVNKAAGTNLPDAASGFRAYSKYSLIRLNVITKFSYCMETIIQAGNKNLAIISIPVETNPKLRESRLFSSTGQHVMQSSMAIMRSYIMFKPFSVFATIGTVLFLLGLVPFIRYAILLWGYDDNGHLQSLVVGILLLISSVLAFSLGILADLLRTNRILLEDNLERTKNELYKK